MLTTCEYCTKEYRVTRPPVFGKTMCPSCRKEYKNYHKEYLRRERIRKAS